MKLACDLFRGEREPLDDWNQALDGSSPSRPPIPSSLRKLSMIPSRFAGMPIDV